MRDAVSMAENLSSFRGTSILVITKISAKQNFRDEFLSIIDNERTRVRTDGCPFSIFANVIYIAIICL